MEAERIAPQAVRYNVIVRELIREMLVRQKRMKTSALHGLAVRAGVLDAILVDVQTGALELTPVNSGTGDAVVDAFDPTWVTSRLRPPR